MKNFGVITLFLLLAFHAVLGQTKASDPADVSSIDAIMRAAYDSISGNAGKVRDWDRFRGLFAKDARLIPVRKDAQKGTFTLRPYSVEEYVERATPLMSKEGFFERESARRVEQFGHIAHVFSTYESRHDLTDTKPFARGINSFQLFFDGKRWWIVTIYWDAESPEQQIPKKYLKGNK